MTDVSAVDPGESAPALESATSARGRRLATILQGQGLIAMALLIAVYFGLSSPFFFTTDNVLIVGATAGPLGIMALAQTFLIVSGGIDVSVGSVVAITTVAAGPADAGRHGLLAGRRTRDRSSGRASERSTRSSWWSSRSTRSSRPSARCPCSRASPSR